MTAGWHGLPSKRSTHSRFFKHPLSFEGNCSAHGFHFQSPQIQDGTERRKLAGRDVESPSHHQSLHSKQFPPDLFSLHVVFAWQNVRQTTIKLRRSAIDCRWHVALGASRFLPGANGCTVAESVWCIRYPFRVLFALRSSRASSQCPSPSPPPAALR